MESRLSRRAFLGRTAAGVASFAVLRGGRACAADKVRCAVIGCGPRGQSHIGATLNEDLVAIVDVSDQALAKTLKGIQDKKKDPTKIKTFVDYRKMFDAMGKDIDAVCIATPNHHHALPALLAMKLGKAAYIEKPLAHDIAEARMLAKVAKEQKVATQMGNQGHNMEGYRRLCEIIWSGAIGNIVETHSWCDRTNGGFGGRPASKPVPAGLHWEEWIGPAPYRDYHDGLHPHDWHHWYDFGNGSIGNMGCHILDGVFWSMKIEHPTSVEAEAISGGSLEQYAYGARLRYDIPARGDLPAFKAYWYEGRQAEKAGDKKAPRFLPRLMAELTKKYPDEKFDACGTFMVGEKGIMATGTYGGAMHLVPIEEMLKVKNLPKTLPRPKDVFSDFLTAVREGKTETAASFEYSARLTEFCLLGNLAERAGVGKKVEWDAPNMTVTNLPELNALVKIEPRKGWSA